MFGLVAELYPLCLCASHLVLGMGCPCSFHNLWWKMAEGGIRRATNCLKSSLQKDVFFFFFDDDMALFNKNCFPVDKYLASKIHSS